MHSFILAGGFATRLWPITERRAKPLLPVGGKPLLSYAIESIPKNMEVTVSTNAVFADDMKAWAKTIGDRHISVTVEDAGHEGEKLGALGAVAKWLREEIIDDDVLLIAGDNFVGCSMEKFLAAAKGSPLIAAHDIADFELAKQFGTVVISGGKVTSFEEKPLKPKSTLVSTGWWWLPKTALSVLKEHAAKHPDNVGGLFEEFLKRGMPVDAFVFTEPWHDIGSFESYLRLHREIVDGKTLCDTSSSLSSDSKALGSNVIGQKVEIRKSSITDCMIFGNSTITDCVLERCIIDEECRLQGVDLTDKMLRANTVLRTP